MSFLRPLSNSCIIFSKYAASDMQKLVKGLYIMPHAMSRLIQGQILLLMVINFPHNALDNYAVVIRPHSAIIKV